MQAVVVAELGVKGDRQQGALAGGDGLAVDGREDLDVGTVLGLILGSIFLFFRQGVVNIIQAMTGANLWDPSVRFLTELPSKTDPFEVLAIILVTLVLTYLFTLFPALRAAKTDPVQVLRYE